MTSLFRSGALVLVGSTLIACGGGGAGGGGLAGGGISGTGSGTITAFGSIFLNDRGEFSTSGATITIDDNPGSESDLNLGMVVQTDISGADDSFSTGNADRVAVSHEIKGPVTALTPLQVFGQTLVTTGDTFVQDDNGLNISLATLQLGDEVEVSGKRDSQGILQASRIERKTVTSLGEWKLVGRVSNLNGNQFDLGLQHVDFTGTSPSDCGAGLQNGNRVAIKGTPTPLTFNPGDTFSADLKVECKPDRLSPDSSLSGTVEGEFEGFVSSTAVSSFTLGDQTVSWSATTTLFEGGTAEDLVVGVKLDARGNFDTQTRVLDADRIRFRDTRFRLEGPATLTASDSVEVLGLTVKVNAQTEDDDNLVGSSGTNQVRVRGFVDSSGTLFADELDDRGPADPGDTRVRGRIDDGTINTVANTFKLFGITVLTNAAQEFRIEDRLVTQQQFFAALKDSSAKDNTEVDVEDGIFNSFNNTLSNAKLQIEIED